MTSPQFRFNPLTGQLDLSDVGGGGSGNVTGPGSSVDTDIAVFDGTDGKKIKDGGKTIAQIAPLTTKGDIYGFTTVPARVPVGANGYALTANSAASSGFDWEPISNTPNAVAFNPGKVVTLVDDFFSSSLANNGDFRCGQLGWQTYGGQWSQGQGTAANPGVAVPTNGAFASMTLDNSDMTASLQPGSGIVSLNYVLKLTTLSALGNRYNFYCGLGNLTPSNGIYFTYSDNVNSGNWQIVCAKQGVGTTTTNTSIPAVTGYVNLGIVINAAGTSVGFFINGVLAGTIATANIPTAAISPIVSFVRTSGALPAALFDLFYMTTTLNNARSGGTVIPVGTTTVAAYTQTPTDYQVLITDATVGVSNTSAPRTITMPNANMAIGQQWTIKDESGGAFTNNITISGNGANIDGSSTTLLNTNYGAVTLYWNGSAFFII